MSVGLPVDKNVLDARMGNLAWEIRSKLAEARLVKAWLDGKSDAELKAAPFSYAQDEVDTARAAYTALDKLALIATAQATQVSVDDFFFHARKLTGLQ